MRHIQQQYCFFNTNSRSYSEQKLYTDGEMGNMRTFFLIVMTLAIYMTQPAYCFATENQEPVKEEKHYPVSIVFENDLIGGTDEGYTNGFIMSISDPWRKESDKKEQGLIFNLGDKLTVIPTEGREKRRTFAFGQAMLTPADLEEKEYIEDDWPYAGLLFGRIIWSYQNDKEADVFGILMGIIGPSSQADTTQIWVHEQIDSEKPEGWDNQLKDEFALNISYEHKWKLYDSFKGKIHSASDMGWDFTSYAGGSLGNVMTDAHVGGIIRFGTGVNLFPSTIYRSGVGALPDIGYNPKAPFAYYFLLGLEGQSIFHSFAMDGNTFENTHDLDRELFTASSFGGIGVGYKRFRLNIFSVRGTKRFKEQGSKHRYGSITLGWIF